MLSAKASLLRIRRISDLKKHPELILGLSSEFIDRKDGWPQVNDTYDLNALRVVGLDHDLAYRGLASREIDVTDLYTTDAEIPFYHISILDDDKKVFAEYQAVFLYRLDLNDRSPKFLKALNRLQGAITAEQMSAMNGDCKIRKQSETQVAATFLKNQLGLKTKATESGLLTIFLIRTREHLLLVSISLSAFRGRQMKVLPEER